MRRRHLLIAGAIVPFADAFVLFHARRNRSGEPESEMELTNQEFTVHVPDEEHGAVTLTLRWQFGDEASAGPRTSWWIRRAEWLDRRLPELGFDCSLPVDAPGAEDYYSRAKRREAFLAFELDGPAWERLRTQMKDAGAEASRLVMVDAARDAAALRARQPDRRRTMILKGIVGIHFDSRTKDQPARIRGHVRMVFPPRIYVPAPFSRELKDLDKRKARYGVTVRVGSLFEPWVAGVRALPGG